MSTVNPETEVQPANPEAWKVLKDLVVGFVEETDPKSNPKSAKSHKRFLLVKEAVMEVKTLINEKTAKIRAAKREIEQLNKAVADLEDTASREPIKNTIEIRRMPSAFTGISSDDATESAPVDVYYVTSDINSVMSRIKPIYEPETGVIGVKVFGTDAQWHVFDCIKFIPIVAALHGREFDVDNNLKDALLVYEAVVSMALELADSYARRYGPFVFVPKGETDEGSRMGKGWVVGNGPIDEGDDIEVSDLDVETSGDDDSDDDSSDESDSTDEDGPTEEEIKSRLAAEEDDSDDIESEDDDETTATNAAM